MKFVNDGKEKNYSEFSGTFLSVDDDSELNFNSLHVGLIVAAQWENRHYEAKVVQVHNPGIYYLKCNFSKLLMVHGFDCMCS